MISRKLGITAGAGVLLLGSGLYFMYSLFAAQGQGELATAPLNSVSSAPPAFIMAVDDSNSMTFERIFVGGDGRLQWNGSSFFKSAGVFYNVGVGCNNNSVDCYVYLFPHNGYNASYTPGRAVPPLDEFGFARSPAYNAGYFNPAVTYEPWRKADGVGAAGLWDAAVPGSTRADPRSDFKTGYNVIYNLTTSRALTSETYSILTGMTLPKGTVYYSSGETCNTTYTDRRGNVISNNDGLPDAKKQWVALDKAWVAPTNCTVPLQYFPATFYLPEAAPAPAGYKTADANRPIIKNACGPSCNLRRYTIISDNYDSGYNDAIKNFANWFQYHRNRILSMVGSSSHAMREIENMRVGYFTINKLVDVTMYDVVKQRADLYKKIYSLAPNGGTPNREAVDFLGKQFSRTGPARRWRWRASATAACCLPTATPTPPARSPTAPTTGTPIPRAPRTSVVRRLATATATPLPISRPPITTGRWSRSAPTTGSPPGRCRSANSAARSARPRRTGSAWTARPICT